MRAGEDAFAVIAAVLSSVATALYVETGTAFAAGLAVFGALASIRFIVGAKE